MAEVVGTVRRVVGTGLVAMEVPLAEVALGIGGRVVALAEVTGTVGRVVGTEVTLAEVTG